MITLKVPFKRGWRHREKKLFFSFNIGALEYATDKLGIELWEITDFLKDKNQLNPTYDLDVTVLYGAYLMACVKKGKEPKYTLNHAVVWNEYMSATEKKKMAEELGRLFGKMKDGSGKAKKKTLK